ncbi:hypothetical protein [Brevibacillus borstelensis]|uniref:hypothetical protein n=1 Tax=Brevibacillus borstelensis TaxID=45462 RepID=UPI0030C4B846
MNFGDQSLLMLHFLRCIWLSSTPHPSQSICEFFGMQSIRALWLERETYKLPPHENMFCQWKQPISFLKLEIAPDFLDKVAEEPGAANRANLRLTSTFLVRDRKLLQLGEWMLAELQSGGASGKLYRDSLANLLAIHC